MMIGHLNASHTGVSGGPKPMGTTGQTRHSGFDIVCDPSRYYTGGPIYTPRPPGHELLQLQPGDFLIAIDGHELKTAENYWRYLTIAPGSKFHLLVNDRPSREGAWEVTIAPANAQAFGDLQYARWVDDRREMVAKLSNGEIGYLH